MISPARGDYHGDQFPQRSLPMGKMPLLLLFSFLLAPLYSQNSGDFSSWLNREQQAFKGYREKEDRAFQDYLRREWEAFNASRGTKQYDEPKNPRQPVLNAGNKSIAGRPDLYSWNSGNSSRIQASSFLDFSVRGVPSTMIELFGVSLRLPRPRQNLPRLKSSSSRDISDYFADLSQTDFSSVEAALNKAAENLNLQDWGYTRLVHAFAAREAGETAAEAYPLTWYLLLRAGYDVRLASDGTRDGYYLLLPVSRKLYNIPFAGIDGKVFYFIDFTGRDRQPTRFFTYPEGHPGATRILEVSFHDQPSLPESVQQRTLGFDFQGVRHEIPLQYDRSVIDFYSEFPQTDFSAYMEAGTSKTFIASIHNSLQPTLDSMAPREAVNFLLRMVQSGLSYRTDQDQFNREKWMLPEETIHYPYSDCDDRALLFSWLVKELLGFKVLGIQWTGHASTAVAIPGAGEGTLFSYKGTQWTLCDPTYLGADAGMVMPAYSGSSFSIIEAP